MSTSHVVVVHHVVSAPVVYVHHDTFWQDLMFWQWMSSQSRPLPTAYVQPSGAWGMTPPRPFICKRHWWELWHFWLPACIR